MKLFLRIFIVLLIITYSFSSQSNIDDLFAEFELSSREKNWKEFSSEDEALDNAIKQEPALLRDRYYMKSSLIHIKALLNKGQIRNAYDLIYSISSELFPAMSRLPQNNHHKVSESMLRVCLENPGAHFDSLKLDYTYAAFELGCALSEYYIMTDQLEYAERLAFFLVGFAEKQSTPNNPFVITDVDLKISCYKQLGDIWTLMKKYDDAHEAYQKAMNLFATGTPSPQEGFVLLGLTHLYTLTSQATEAREMLALSSPHFDNGQSRLGEACVKLASAEIDYVFNTITDGSFDNVNAAGNTFSTVGDLYKQGLALLLQHKMLNAIDHDDEELAEQLFRNVSDLAQKEYLPLLARQVRGQDYEPQIISDQENDDASQSVSGSVNTDPFDFSGFGSTPPSAELTFFSTHSSFTFIPTTQSAGRDPGE